MRCQPASKLRFSSQFILRHHKCQNNKGIPRRISKRNGLGLWGLTQRGPCQPHRLVFKPWPQQMGMDMLVSLTAPDLTGGVLEGSLCSRTNLRLWEATLNLQPAGLPTKPHWSSQGVFQVPGAIDGEPFAQLRSMVGMRGWGHPLSVPLVTLTS